MRVGAHVSAAGGLDKAIDRAQDIGAETIQIFASSPRGWAFKPHTEDSVAAFRQKAEVAGIVPVFLHAIYLLNLGGTPELVRKSIQSLVDHMNVAGQIGATGVIFHAGGYKDIGFDAVLGPAANAMTEVLERSSPGAALIIENSAGLGSRIGASFLEIGQMVKAVDSPRTKVCLDTQHAMASGYDMGSRDGLDAAMEEFDREIGISRLVAVHANDSKVAVGSGVDRHENIGEGSLGIEGFETIMGHPTVRDIPFVLEVPGFNKKGPDKANLDLLKDIRSRLDLSP